MKRYYEYLYVSAKEKVDSSLEVTGQPSLNYKVLCQ